METTGTTLRQVREAKKLSLDDVSKATKLSAKVLHALEADELSKLPSEVYVRAFMKTYAGFLGIAAEVMEQYEKNRPPIAAPISVMRPASNLVGMKVETQQRRLSLKKHLFPGLVLGTGMLALTVWILIPKPKEAEQPPVVGLAAKKAASIDKSQPVVLTPPAATLTVDRKQASQTEHRAVQSARDGLYLEIVAIDKMWLRVKADNLFLFEGTINRGDRQSWQAQREFVLRVGSAGAVNLYLNDQDLGKIGNKGEVKTVVISKDGIVKTR